MVLLTILTKDGVTTIEGTVNYSRIIKSHSKSFVGTFPSFYGHSDDDPCKNRIVSMGHAQCWFNQSHWAIFWNMESNYKFGFDFNYGTF